MTASGYILFDKPEGKTSFAALDGFKKSLPGTKIGHTGTLDSFASGLLVVVAGSYGRLARHFVGLDKVYRAQVRFGVETDTLDPQGLSTAAGPIPSRADLEAVIPRFIGAQRQIPPRYSALHIEGRRASDLARKGVEFEMKPRDITIYSLTLEAFGNDAATILVECSSGTYIRSLARDLAGACGTVAHLTALRRLKVGRYSVDDASSGLGGIPVVRELVPGQSFLLGLLEGSIPGEKEQAFRNGMASALDSIETTAVQDGEMLVFSRKGQLLGLVEKRGRAYSYVRLMPTEEKPR